MPKRRTRFIALAELLARHNMDADERTIKAGRVLVDGRVVFNPSARVRADASIQVRRHARLRGDIKLSYALDQLGLRIAGRVAADIGASAGGFTTALLDRGARRVYAIDAGFGQLVGRLRADERVVNLEGHNLGVIGQRAVPEPVDVITVDLSYLSVTDAIPQLETLDISHDADLVALVKPTFELRRGRPPETDSELELALTAAVEAVAASPWRVEATFKSQVTGAGGTTEFFIHAHRRAAP
jgi:23S rRNA (cytidine1920-2'-O)/16S rRNA (cytidine1409-2'-O)-methyltransferase